MFRLINKLKNRKGFTLIELIVVLAVLAIIMAIAVPRFLGVQEDAEEKADENTLQMIAKAAELYYAQNPDGTAITTADDLVDEGYLDEIKFNTDTYGATSGSEVSVTNSTSGGVILKVSGTQVYP